jgi:prefoldin beta subunit
LTPDSTVYKLIGPTLIKQETDSAKGNVAKRLEYLNAEAARLEQTYKDLERQLGEKKQLVCVHSF